MAQAAYLFRGRVLRKLGEKKLAQKDLETALIYEGISTDKVHPIRVALLGCLCFCQRWFVYR